MNKFDPSKKHLNNLHWLAEHSGIYDRLFENDKKPKAQFKKAQIVMPANPIPDVLDDNQWRVAYGHGFLQLSHSKIADLEPDITDTRSIGHRLKKAALKLNLPGYRKENFIKWAAENSYDELVKRQAEFDSQNSSKTQKLVFKDRYTPPRPESFKNLSTLEWEIFFLCGCKQYNYLQAQKRIGINTGVNIDVLYMGDYIAIVAQELGYKPNSGTTVHDYLKALGQKYLEELEAASVKVEDPKPSN